MCYDSYRDLNNDLKCIPVQTKIEFCQKYHNETECFTCKSGYYSEDGKCQKLTLSNCFESLDNITCMLCDGQSDDDLKCLGKPSTIDNCLSSFNSVNTEICIKCKLGYQNNMIKCVKKSSQNDGCLFSTHGICSGCQYGYYDNNNHELSSDCKVSPHSNKESMSTYGDSIIENSNSDTQDSSSTTQDSSSTTQDSSSTTQDSRDKFCMIKQISYIFTVMIIIVISA